jgi:cell division protein FtsI/penicillin-binding protein 2
MGIVLWIGGLAFGLIAGKLTLIQLVQRDIYAGQSSVSRIRQINDEPRRGMIVDRNGRALVMNVPAATIVFDANILVKQTGEPEELLNATRQGLQDALPGLDLASMLVSSSEILLRRNNARPRFQPIELVRDIDVAKLDLKVLRKLPGIGIVKTTKRSLASGEIAASVIGLLGRDASPLSGMELAMNEHLLGVPGQRYLAKDLDGIIPGTEEIVSKVKHGNDVVLTIDSVLQSEAETLVQSAVTKSQAQYGSIVVLDATTGDVLVMANTTGAETLKTAPKGEQKRLLTMNWAVEGANEPGSTFKSFTIASALDAGVITTNSSFFCNGERRIGKRAVHCAPHGAFQNGHASQDVSGVIKHSCNVGTAEIASRLGWDRLTSTLHAVGCGQRLQIGLNGATRGVFPENESKIGLATLSFGQGPAISPLHLASAYGAFVDGRFRHPTLIHAVRDQLSGAVKLTKRSDAVRVFSSETATQMRSLLRDVIETGTGTKAQLAFHDAGGKTGTAQMVEDGRYSGKYMASFVGLAPINDPKFIVAVTIAAPKGDHYGGSVAGPVFKEVMERAMVRYDIQPTRTKRQVSHRSDSSSKDD